MFSSCNQQQRAADVRESGSAGGMLNGGGIDSLPRDDSGSSGSLDPFTEHCIRSYGPAIKRYAGQYGLDWRLILAIMKQESLTPGTSKTGGAVQLIPVTGGEHVRKLSLEGLSQPEHVIQTAVFYLRNLYDMFEGSGEADRLKLMLAAYDAGLVRINDAQELAAYLHDEPARWIAVREALPLLSRQFSTLQSAVWGQGKPKSGWFDNSRETIEYVNSVMDNFDVY